MIHKLTQLLTGVSNYSFKGTDREIVGIADDSRLVKAGYLFVAVKGLRSDGHDYIDQAIDKGAIAVLGLDDPKPEWLNRVTYVKVDDPRDALGRIASEYYGNPSRKMKLIGVTGTDGKTTTSNILAHILTTAGHKTGLVSTISAKIDGKEYDTGFHVSNPTALALHSFLAKMVEKKCEYAVLEVTSHGLTQGRVAGIEFDIGVLTNITNEHLDYHKTYDAYVEAKSKLFEHSVVAILNKDDSSFEKMRPLIDDPLKIKTYSRESQSDIYAEDMDFGEKMTFLYSYDGKKTRVTSNLIGGFNVSNSLAAILTSKLLGITDKDIQKAFTTIVSPKGRLQIVPNSKDITILIDYAHTPNGVSSVINEFKNTKGKVISIVSAEGERDPGKRFDIPRVSVEHCDITILNPIDVRSEKSENILKEMEKGAKAGGGVKVTKESAPTSTKGHTYVGILDRGEAIYFALNSLAKKGDTVLILGKGHETGMDFGDYEAPWSDTEATKLALKGKVFKIKKA